MSIKSDRAKTNKAKTNSYPMIDDITGFRISSKDAVTSYTGALTHKNNIKPGPSPLDLDMSQITDDVQHQGDTRPDHFTWSSRELYDFNSDVLFNDINYRTANGYNIAALNPQITLLQNQNAAYWNTTNATWNAVLLQFVNRTYNSNIQFVPDTILATWGEDIVPTFIQFQPE